MRSNGSSQALPSKELVKEINALKAQLKRVSDAMAHDATEGVNRTVETVEAKSKETIDDAVAAAQRFIDDYAETAKEAAGRLARKSAEMRDSAADTLIHNVEARPFSSLAAVLGIGFLAGYLCRRS